MINLSFSFSAPLPQYNVEHMLDGVPGHHQESKKKSTLELGEQGEDRATESAEDCSNGQKRTEVDYLGGWAS